MKKKTGRKMKLEPRFGTICCLPGNRRKPYMARTKPTGETAAGDPTRRVIGYFETYEEAYIALIEYNHTPYDLDVKSLTFEDVYRIALKDKESSPKGITTSLRNSYNAGFNKSHRLHKLKFSSINAVVLQNELDSLSTEWSESYLKSIKNTWRMIWKYALKTNLVTVDYVKMVDVNRQDDVNHCVAFTKEEVQVLWDNLDNINAVIALVMCYSGFRNQEFRTLKVDLENNVFYGGLKTDAGKDRTVPIHHRIIPLVKILVDKNVLFGRTTTSNYLRIRKLTDLGLNHKPHDCRATFATMLDDAEVEEPMIKRLMGHSLAGNITQDIYIQKTVDDLREAVEKLP